MLTTSECNYAGNFHSLSFVHSLPIYFHCRQIANICSQKKEHSFRKLPDDDDESDEMESTEKKQPSKKVLFEAIDLIENFALFQNDDIAKQLRKHTAQLNQLLTSSSRKKQSTIPSYFTCVTVE